MRPSVISMSIRSRRGSVRSARRSRVAPQRRTARRLSRPAAQRGKCLPTAVTASPETGRRSAPSPRACPRWGSGPAKSTGLRREAGSCCGHVPVVDRGVQPANHLDVISARSVSPHRVRSGTQLIQHQQGETDPSVTLISRTHLGMSARRPPIDAAASAASGAGEREGREPSNSATPATRGQPYEDGRPTRGVPLGRPAEGTHRWHRR